MAKPSAKQAEALKLRRTGASYRDIATRVGTSEKTVRNWEKRAKAAAPAEPEPAPLVEHVTEDPPAAPALPLDADALTRAKHLQAKCFEAYEAAQRDGNHTAASKALRDAGAQSILIARLEKGLKSTEDLVSIPRSEVDSLINGVRERVATLARVPLTCPDCGRALRIRAVKGE